MSSLVRSRISHKSRESTGTETSINPRVSLTVSASSQSLRSSSNSTKPSSFRISHSLNTKINLLLRVNKSESDKTRTVTSNNSNPRTSLSDLNKPIYFITPALDPPGSKSRTIAKVERESLKMTIERHTEDKKSAPSVKTSVLKAQEQYNEHAVKHGAIGNKVIGKQQQSQNQIYQQVGQESNHKEQGSLQTDLAFREAMSVTSENNSEIGEEIQSERGQVKFNFDKAKQNSGKSNSDRIAMGSSSEPEQDHDDTAHDDFDDAHSKQHSETSSKASNGPHSKKEQVGGSASSWRPGQQDHLSNVGNSLQQQQQVLQNLNHTSIKLPTVIEVDSNRHNSTDTNMTGIDLSNFNLKQDQVQENKFAPASRIISNNKSETASKGRDTNTDLDNDDYDINFEAGPYGESASRRESAQVVNLIPGSPRDDHPDQSPQFQIQVMKSQTEPNTTSTSLKKNSVHIDHQSSQLSQHSLHSDITNMNQSQNNQNMKVQRVQSAAVSLTNSTQTLGIDRSLTNFGAQSLDPETQMKMINQRMEHSFTQFAAYNGSKNKTSNKKKIQNKVLGFGGALGNNVSSLKRRVTGIHSKQSGMSGHGGHGHHGTESSNTLSPYNDNKQDAVNRVLSVESGLSNITHRNSYTDHTGLNFIPPKPQHNHHHGSHKNKQPWGKLGKKVNKLNQQQSELSNKDMLHNLNVARTSSMTSLQLGTRELTPTSDADDDGESQSKNRPEIPPISGPSADGSMLDVNQIQLTELTDQEDQQEKEKTVTINAGTAGTAPGTAAAPTKRKSFFNKVFSSHNLSSMKKQASNQSGDKDSKGTTGSGDNNSNQPEKIQKFQRRLSHIQINQKNKIGKEVSKVSNPGTLGSRTSNEGSEDEDGKGGDVEKTESGGGSGSKMGSFMGKGGPLGSKGINIHHRMINRGKGVKKHKSKQSKSIRKHEEAELGIAITCLGMQRCITQMRNEQVKSGNEHPNPRVTLPASDEYPIPQPECTLDFLEDENFKAIRKNFGISDKEFYETLVLPSGHQVSNLFYISQSDAAGKSLSFFALTHNQRFILKSCIGGDKDVLLRILPAFREHVEQSVDRNWEVQNSNLDYLLAKSEIEQQQEAASNGPGNPINPAPQSVLQTMINQKESGMTGILTQNSSMTNNSNSGAAQHTVSFTENQSNPNSGANSPSGRINSELGTAQTQNLLKTVTQRSLKPELKKRISSVSTAFIPPNLDMIKQKNSTNSSLTGGGDPLPTVHSVQVGQIAAEQAVTERLSNLIDGSASGAINPYFMQQQFQPLSQTMLPRYVGLLTLTFNIGGNSSNANGQQKPLEKGDKNYIPPVTFVIMTNFFAGRYEISTKYDLKGSSVGRKASKKERAKQHPTLKDLDWIDENKKLTFPNEDMKNKIISQIKKDSEFLKRWGLIDYSLLVGTHVMSEDEEENYDGVEPFNVFHIRNGRQIEYLGVIDILTIYTRKKKLETFCCGTICCCRNISCQPPDIYAERFFRFVHSICECGENEV